MNTLALKTIGLPQTTLARAVAAAAPAKFESQVKKTEATLARVMVVESVFAVCLAIWISSRAWPAPGRHFHGNIGITLLLVAGVTLIPAIVAALMLSLRRSLNEMRQLAEQAVESGAELPASRVTECCATAN